MTQAAKVNLTQAVFFNNMAMQLFEAAGACMYGSGKASMNLNATRCRANENDVFAKCINEQAREHFRNEIKRGDTLRFANIFDLFLRMNEEERDTVERMIECIKRGELIEVKEQEIQEAA
jgi:hypothetical protein